MERLFCFLVLAVVKINQLKCVRILRGIYKNYRNVEKRGGGVQLSNLVSLFLVSQLDFLTNCSTKKTKVGP